MKKMILFAALLGMAVMQSCTSYKSTVSGTRIMEPEIKRLMADLEVGTERVTASFSIENTRYKKNRMVGEKDMMLNAVYDALLRVNADAMIGVQYKMYSEYDYKLQIRTRTITVTGYPVWYRNFRPVPEVKTQFDVKELKADTPYVIIEKNSKGEEKDYRVITSTKVKNDPVIHLDKMALKKIVIGKDDKKKE